jgi:hypothetical protein
VILLDDIERLLEYAAIGPHFSNAILQVRRGSVGGPEGVSFYFIFSAVFNTYPHNKKQIYHLSV